MCPRGTGEDSCYLKDTEAIVTIGFLFGLLGPMGWPQSVRLCTMWGGHQGPCAAGQRLGTAGTGRPGQQVPTSLQPRPAPRVWAVHSPAVALSAGTGEGCALCGSQGSAPSAKAALATATAEHPICQQQRPMWRPTQRHPLMGRVDCRRPSWQEQPDEPTWIPGEAFTLLPREALLAEASQSV